MRGAGILAYCTISIVWGSTFLGIRIADETLPPVLMIAVRSALAGAVLVGAARLAGARLPDARGLGRAALTGTILFLFGQAVLAWGEVRIASGPAAVLNATLALFMPFCSWALGAARAPRPAAIAGLLLGFGGVAVMARPGTAPLDAAGAAATVSAAFCFALGSAITRRYPPSDSVFMTAGLQMLLGGVAGLAASVAIGEMPHLHAAAISTRSLLAFLYLVIMGSLVAFGAFSWLVRVWPPDRLATYTFINPVVALALGAAVGEPVGAREMVAIALILAAVGLVMRSGPAAARAVAEGADIGAAPAEGAARCPAGS